MSHETNRIVRRTGEITGSFQSMSEKSGGDLATAMVGMEIILLVDLSGSMDMVDYQAHGHDLERLERDRDGNILIPNPHGGITPMPADAIGKTRKDRAQTELSKIQNAHPNKVGLVCFADYALFCPNGKIMDCGYMTNLTGALEFVKMVDGLEIDIVVVSDGAPNNMDSALKIAGTFESKIHTMYIGGDYGGGEDFLKELATLTGGQDFGNEVIEKLTAHITALLTEG